MDNIIWVTLESVLAIHDMQLAEHGGLSGVRDENLLHSALSRPENQLAYGTPDFADLAAAYGYGIARNHPFSDANKRTAFITTLLFLRLNGHRLDAEPAARVLTMIAVAEGELGEVDFAAWLRGHLVKT